MYGSFVVFSDFKEWQQQEESNALMDLNGL